MATPLSPQATDSSDIEPYTMHVSSRYLDLTKKKLELTRMPREIPLAGEGSWALGTPKFALEPLIDYWLESYDWRAQEALFNSSLRQYRTTIQHPPPPSHLLPGDITNIDIEAVAADAPPDATRPESLRMHFLHHRSSASTAIPLLYCHTWPGSFLEIARCIDALANPVATPTQQQSGQTYREQVAFHVVAPSLPGFGFSDASSMDGFGARDAAGVLVGLMGRLGYERFGVWGDGWGFKIARMLAMHHPKHIAAIFTGHAIDLPAPQALKHKDAWLKYHIAKLTGARFPWLSFGYTSSDFGAADMKFVHTEDEDGGTKAHMRRKLRKARSNDEEDIELGVLPTSSHARHTNEESGKERAAAEEEPLLKGQLPSSLPSKWRDFPPSVVAKRPQTISYGLCDSPAGLLALVLDALKPTITYTAQRQPQTRHRSATIVQHASRPLSTVLEEHTTIFTPADMLNWTMMYWLPGPEASLRWLLAVEKEDCYAEYSDVPLGVSWYANISSEIQKSSAGPLRARTSSQNPRAPSKLPMRDERPRARPVVPAAAGNESPMWASAVQNLKWVKRRNELLESGVPAWERTVEAVLDIREYFELGRSEGWLGL